MGEEVVKCPVCSTVASEQYSEPWQARRFMCKRLTCMEMFRVSRAHFMQGPSQHVADEIERKAKKLGINLEDRSEQSEGDNLMAAACAKGCGKEFKFEAWREKHEQKCDGTPKPSPGSKAGHAARHKKAATSSSDNMNDVIADLKMKRERIVLDLIGDNKDIKALDIAIDALENRPK